MRADEKAHGRTLRQEACKKQREEFEKRSAEWRAKCEANPEECQKRREEYRKRRGMPEKEGS